MFHRERGRKKVRLTLNLTYSIPLFTKKYFLFNIILISYLKRPENLWKAGGPARKATSATSANPNAGTCILRHNL